MSSTLPPSLSLDFCGLKFDSPIVLLSGCVGFGEEYTRVEGFSNREVGAIVLKGTTREPRLGNPPHRVYETPMGMLNAIGLQNPGVDQVVDRILPTLDFAETRFFANVCGSTIDDYVEVTRRFDDSPIDAIELNISCPNIKEGGITFGCSLTGTHAVVSAVRKVTALPIIPKLTPNVTDVASFARAAEDAGADAVLISRTVSVTNEVRVSPGMVMGPPYGFGWGGFYGYYHGMWSAAYAMPPSVYTVQNVLVDTRLFDARDFVVLWSGSSTTTPTNSMQTTISEFVTVLIGQLAGAKAI